MDTAKLLLFTTVTASVSIMPGPQMVFVLTQSAWRGHRAGISALAGLQLGNLCWFAAAGLGLGTVALAWPRAIALLAAAGAFYLGWLGWKAIAGAGRVTAVDTAAPRSRHALRDSLAIALSNPKSLVYVLALLPPFLDFGAPLSPQLAVLAAIAIFCDLIVGLVYVGAGSGLAAAMARPAVRVWLERAIGIIFLTLAAGILSELLRTGGRIG